MALHHLLVERARGGAIVVLIGQRRQLAQRGATGRILAQRFQIGGFGFLGTPGGGQPARPRQQALESRRDASFHGSWHGIARSFCSRFWPNSSTAFSIASRSRISVR